MKLCQILIILVESLVVVVWTFQPESNQLDIVCDTYVEEQTLRCSWNCTGNEGKSWKICYSKDNVNWEWRVVEECSHTITSNSSSIHYNIHMKYTVAVGLERPDCHFSSYKVIDPKERENILNPVDDLRVDATNNTSATLSWMRRRNLKLNIQCHCRATSFITSRTTETMVTHHEGSRTRCELMGLHPFTSYNVTVKCKPEDGSFWVTNPHKTIITHEAAPASPPLDVSVRVVTRSVILTWSPPPIEDQNGIISKYIIKYNKGSVTSQTDEIVVPSDTREYTFSSLQCYTEYTFSISAKTVAESPISKFSTVLTSICAPSQMNIQKISVDVMEDGTRIVHVNGSTPAHINGPAPQYVTVAQWEGGSRQTTSSTPATSLQLECPQDQESPLNVRFTMYAVNYYNGTALGGPPGDIMDQTLCPAVWRKNDLFPLIMTAVSVFVLFLCTAAVFIIKKKM